MAHLEKYSKTFKMGLQSAIEYRMNFILSIFSNIFPIIIQTFLWIAIYQNSKEKSIYGYTFSQMIMYTIMAGVISKLMSSGIENEVMSDIKDGGLSKYIVKPISYFGYRISSYLGEKSMHLIISGLLLASAMLVINFVVGIEIQLGQVISFIVAIAFSLILNVLFSLIISSLSFWITEAWAAFMILNLVINIFSGGVFPLDIFGEKAMAVFNALPFKYVVFFPISIINGRLEQGYITQGIFTQCIWIIILYLISKVLWSLGMKKYVSIGG